MHYLHTFTQESARITVYGKIELKGKYAYRGPFKPRKNRALRAVICGFVSHRCAKPA